MSAKAAPRRSAAPSNPARTAELAFIHTAKKFLALTDESYQAIILRFSSMRTDSSGAMTGAERQKVIQHFRDLGFTTTAKKPKTAADRRADYRPQAQKLSALWYSLYQLGVVRDPGQEACAAFVCRHTQISVMKWNDADDLRRAIECLKAWCEREGYWARPCDLAGPQLGSYKPGLISAQWDKLIRLGAFRHAVFADIATWFHHQGWLVSAPNFLDDDAAEAAIGKLGVWIRRISSSDAAGVGTTEGPDG
jgi:hypothetical protein